MQTRTIAAAVFTRSRLDGISSGWMMWPGLRLVFVLFFSLWVWNYGSRDGKTSKLPITTVAQQVIAKISLERKGVGRYPRRIRLLLHFGHFWEIIFRSAAPANFLIVSAILGLRANTTGPSQFDLFGRPSAFVCLNVIAAKVKQSIAVEADRLWIVVLECRSLGTLDKVRNPDRYRTFLSRRHETRAGFPRRDSFEARIQ